MTASSARAGTHHERILAEIRAKILGRTWAPGFRLPFETDLAASYGVSRMTMNKVLSELAREGLLIRRRKLGTFVATPRAQTAVLAIPDIRAEVEALGLTYRFELLSREERPATAAERQQAGMAPDDPADDRADDRTGGLGAVLSIDGLHHAGDTPFCLETRIINLAMAPGARDQDFSAEGPGGWLLREIPWTAAEHRIGAVNASGATARALRLTPGDACLEVRRRTETAGRWVTLVRQTYPGGRHQLVAHFNPGTLPPVTAAAASTA